MLVVFPCMYLVWSGRGDYETITKLNAISHARIARSHPPLFALVIKYSPQVIAPAEIRPKVFGFPVAPWYRPEITVKILNG